MTRPVEIHPTAIVEKGASLGQGVRIGPYAIVSSEVEIDDGCRIDAHAVLAGRTRLGQGSHVFPFAVVGMEPQDLKYDGEPTLLIIGRNNTIREFASLHCGTEGGGGKTVVGEDNLFMAYSHVAHDCRIGSGVVMANAATLAGHVSIEDFAIVGGLVAVHQHCRVGESAILGGGAMVSLDVPPYCMATGDRARLHGLNLLGLKRRGFNERTLHDLRSAYRILFRSSLKLADALARLKQEYRDSAEVGRLVRFIEGSQRGICR